MYITANKNTIPNEQRSPFVTSGVRLGTPAVTTRGLKEADMDVIAECIRLCATDFDNRADAIREKVTELLQANIRFTERLKGRTRMRRTACRPHPPENAR